MRYVVVGLGNIGRRRRALLGARCVATVDPFASDADVPDITRCDPASYDAAVLAVPTSAKLDLLEQLLALGKHVLVEKPLVIPDRQALERLERLGEARQVCWYTSYNHRFEPLIKELRERYRGGAIGDLYYARMVYANGTVQHVKGTWRDAGLGVIEDLAPHLLDLVSWILDEQPAFETWAAQRHEAKAPDHSVIATRNGRLELDVSYLSWKNHFEIEMIGPRGSLHLEGLRKWGPCELVLRERVLPSGVPKETRVHDEGADETWQQDLAEFERRAAAKISSASKDWWISESLRACERGLTV